MHTYVYRLNVLLTEAITLLALMCAIASLSDKLNVASPSADIQVLHINWFHKQRNGNDEVSLTMNVSADLKSTFTWNTKQVFVFLAMKNLYGIPSSKPQLFCAIITASPLLSSPSGIYG